MAKKPDPLASSSDLQVNSTYSQDTSQISITRQFKEDEKKILKRKKYLQLFSSKASRYTRINHLMNDIASGDQIQKTDLRFTRGKR